MTSLKELNEGGLAALCEGVRLSRVWLFATQWSPPGSSVHRICQAIILEWVVISFSRGSFWPRDQTQVCCTAGRLHRLHHQGSPLPGTKGGVKGSWGFCCYHLSAPKPRTFFKKIIMKYLYQFMFFPVREKRVLETGLGIWNPGQRSIAG